MSWQLQNAKQRFSELVERARREGPQLVTKHGREAVVVVSAEEYRPNAELDAAEEPVTMVRSTAASSGTPSPGPTPATASDTGTPADWSV